MCHHITSHHNTTTSFQLLITTNGTRCHRSHLFAKTMCTTHTQTHTIEFATAQSLPRFVLQSDLQFLRQTHHKATSCRHTYVLYTKAVMHDLILVPSSLPITKQSQNIQHNSLYLTAFAINVKRRGILWIFSHHKSMHLIMHQNSK